MTNTKPLDKGNATLFEKYKRKKGISNTVTSLSNVNRNTDNNQNRNTDNNQHRNTMVKRSISDYDSDDDCLDGFFSFLCRLNFIDP